jgi:hypothetical protein
MGTANFFKGNKPKPISGGNMNMMSRAFSAPGYAARGDAAVATKDIGAAAGINKGGAFKGTTRDAASNAPGPKT